MTSVIEIIKPKRGRRSKKEIAAALAATAAATASSQNLVISLSSSHAIENVNANANVSNIELQICNDYTDDNIFHDTSKTANDNQELIGDENVIIKPPPKKRGRKPKGGKIILQTLPIAPQKEAKPNIILHLKCSMKDLQSDGDHNSNFTVPNIESFNFARSKNDLLYEVISNPVNPGMLCEMCEIDEINTKCNTVMKSNLSSNSTPSTVVTGAIGYGSLQIMGISQSPSQSSQLFNYSEKIIENITYNTNLNSTIISAPRIAEDHDDNHESTEIWRKLKTLEHNLHINNVSDKKSACFWCSHDFDNPPIYIPKHFIKDSYQVYGCFCTPECAVAHLMEDNIDTSTKFERYHLLNHIYSKIYNYKKNIKPAPNPYYMLERYYGNLTIQEYRSLLKSERLFLIVDKPLTRILPEFHEDNDEFIINNKIIPSNNYQVKKRLQKKTQSKSHIMNEQFGVNT